LFKQRTVLEQWIDKVTANDKAVEKTGEKRLAAVG